MAVNYLTHSRKKWRKLGYYVEGTEFNLTIPDEKGRPRPIKKDLHGFSDLIAQNDDEQVYLQVTSWGNMSAAGDRVLPSRRRAHRQARRPAPRAPAGIDDLLGGLPAL